MKEYEKIEYSEALKEAVSKAGWSITNICFTDDGSKKPFYIEFSSYSPAGEDLSGECVWFDGTDEGLKAALTEHANNFDADELAELWFNSLKLTCVPSTLRELINDAREIVNDADAVGGMLQVLAKEVNKVNEPMIALGKDFRNL